MPPQFCLISDVQAKLLKRGINVLVLNGETSSAERKALFTGIGKNDVEVVITTPEIFFSFLMMVASCGVRLFMIRLRQNSNCCLLTSAILFMNGVTLDFGKTLKSLGEYLPS